MVRRAVLSFAVPEFVRQLTGRTTPKHRFLFVSDLDLERKALENQLLKRQIDLLDKAQEYRCCPAGEEHEEDDDQ